MPLGALMRGSRHLDLSGMRSFAAGGLSGTVSSTVALDLGRPTTHAGTGGLFHITFDRDNPYQLLRISLPTSAGLYPEISGSHYRCSVRFLKWNGLTARPTQTEADVPFILSCCG